MPLVVLNDEVLNVEKLIVQVLQPLLRPRKARVVLHLLVLHYRLADGILPLLRVLVLGEDHLPQALKFPRDAVHVLKLLPVLGKLGVEVGAVGRQLLRRLNARVLAVRVLLLLGVAAAVEVVVAIVAVVAAGSAIGLHAITANF